MKIGEAFALQETDYLQCQYSKCVCNTVYFG